MVKVKNLFKRWVASDSVVSLIVGLIVFVVSFAALINSIVIGDLVKVGFAAAALILYGVPFVVTTFCNVPLSAALEITYYLFIFASLILGEVFAFYGPFPFWDVILHFLSGFVLAGIGLSVVKFTNQKGKISKLFALVFAFCFSVTLGILWECLEFGFDMIARTDAQKDAHLHSISTITLQRDGGNRPVKVDNIVKTDIHLASDEIVTIDEGFLDIGLMDTMKDVLVNITGAMVFCVFGYFCLKNDKNNTFLKGFVPTK